MYLTENSTVEGNTIVREAYASESGDEAIIKLPVGGSYTLAVLAVNYSEAYMTTCQVDLTEAVEGYEIPVALAADEGWITHEIPMSEAGELHLCAESGLRTL